MQVPCGMCGGEPSILPCPRCRDRRWMPKTGVAIFPPKFEQQAKIRRRARLRDMWDNGFQRHDPGLFDKKNIDDVNTVLRIFEKWLSTPTHPSGRHDGEKAKWEAGLARWGWWLEPPTREEIELQFQRKREELGVPMKKDLEIKPERKKFKL